MAIVDVRDVSVLEVNSFSTNATFTLFLDQIATAPVTVSYFLQSETAAEATGDFDERSGTITFAVGTSQATLNIPVNGDTLIEGNETFRLVLVAGPNASLADGAAALIATATILDNDDALPDPIPGDGELAQRLYGPVALPGVLPTLDVRGVGLIEGNSFSDPARFLITLDRVATAPVTVSYYMQSVTASEASGDYDDRSGTVTIQPGRQSTWVEIPVYGDTLIEGNEAFQIVLTNVSNAVFAGGAEALVASATIIDDDGATPSGPFGIGNVATQIQGPVSESATMPTLSVRDIAVIEGNSFSDPARFLVTLDRPAPTSVTLLYSINGGSASENQNDFDQRSGTITLPAGTESAWIETGVNGDNLIEGDEAFTLVLSGITNAVFENGAVALVATATILDDDGGALSGPAGIGAPAKGVEAPVSGTGGIIVDVVNTSLNEGNSFSDDAFIHILLSQPATTTMTMQYTTLTGTAQANVDFAASTSTLTIAAGVQSTWLRIPVYGDINIEGDESFSVRFSNLTGGTFANGLASIDATVLIRDDDGTGTAGAPETGPEFSFIVSTPGATEGADVLTGGPGNDALNALGGNDRLFGLGGDDRLIGWAGADFLDGGAGNDTMEGGLGNDFYIVDSAGDVIRGEIGFAQGGGIDTVRTFIDNFVAPTNIELVRITEITDTDNFSVTGNDAPGTLVGNAGNNTLNGRGGNDQINGNGGNDVLIGGEGRDTLVGGSGADTFVYTSISNSRAGAANRDVINGFDRGAVQDRIDLSAIDANTTTFGTNDAFTFIGSAAFGSGGSSAGQLRTVGLGGPNAVLLEGDVNGDRVADFQIFVNTTTYMTGTDFIL